MISLKDIRPYVGPADDQIGVSGNGIQRFIDDHDREGGIDLDPDFQRGHVWTDENRTRFVEHLLRGGQHGASSSGTVPCTRIATDGRTAICRRRWCW